MVRSCPYLLGLSKEKLAEIINSNSNSRTVPIGKPLPYCRVDARKPLGTYVPPSPAAAVLNKALEQMEVEQQPRSETDAYMPNSESSVASDRSMPQQVGDLLELVGQLT